MFGVRKKGCASGEGRVFGYGIESLDKFGSQRMNKLSSVGFFFFSVGSARCLEVGRNL